METTQQPLKLVLPLATYRKIMAYVTVCDVEISGFADVEYNSERNAIIASEVYLLEQTCGGASTHLEEEDMHKFNLQMIKKGATQLPRLWWHSHVNMEAFFSGTDEATSDLLQNETFNVSLVLNKRREMKAMIYIAVKNEMTGQAEYQHLDPLPVSIDLDYQQIPESIKKEVEKKVNIKKYQQPKQQDSKWDYQEWKKEFENKDQNNKGEKNKGDTRKSSEQITRVLHLPKNPTEAADRIERLGLRKEWDHTEHQFVYVNDKTGEKWVDFWESLEKYDNTNYGSD